MKEQRDASFADYMAASIKDPAEATAYMEAVMQLDDAAALLVALRHFDKAHGMAEVARQVEVSDKRLFTAVSDECAL